MLCHTVADGTLSDKVRLREGMKAVLPVNAMLGLSRQVSWLRESEIILRIVCGRATGFENANS